jgi:hypothetical protein
MLNAVIRNLLLIQRLKQEMMALRQSNQQLPVLAQTRQRVSAYQQD